MHPTGTWVMLMRHGPRPQQILRRGQKLLFCPEGVHKVTGHGGGETSVKRLTGTAVWVSRRWSTLSITRAPLSTSLQPISRRAIGHWCSIIRRCRTTCIWTDLEHATGHGGGETSTTGTALRCAELLIHLQSPSPHTCSLWVRVWGCFPSVEGLFSLYTCIVHVS